MRIGARKLGTEQQELLRQQAVQLRLQGKSFKEIGGLLNVHPNTAGLA
ncbi:helix-turn-helix domain-containing protein [Candidatus Vondammii sp. HM_W22]